MSSTGTMSGWDRRATARASARNRAFPASSPKRPSAIHFSATGRPSSGSPRLEHDAHAAAAQLLGELVAAYPPDRGGWGRESLGGVGGAEGRGGQAEDDVAQGSRRAGGLGRGDRDPRASGRCRAGTRSRRGRGGRRRRRLAGRRPTSRRGGPRRGGSTRTHAASRRPWTSPAACASPIAAHSASPNLATAASGSWPALAASTNGAPAAAARTGAARPSTHTSPTTRGNAGLERVCRVSTRWRSLWRSTTPRASPSLASHQVGVAAIRHGPATELGVWTARHPGLLIAAGLP
jgi:hypothetical protein